LFPKLCLNHLALPHIRALSARSLFAPPRSPELKITCMDSSHPFWPHKQLLSPDPWARVELFQDRKEMIRKGPASNLEQV